MWLVWGMALAVAADAEVGLQIGAQRALTTTIAPGWSATTHTATKRCWVRGGVAEACLEVSDRKGRDAQAIIDAQKSGLEILQCEPAKTEAMGAAVAQFQMCKVRQGLQDQIRAWHVIVDTSAAGVATFKLTAEDAGARTDGDRFIGGLTLKSPDSAKTRGTPVCAALETVLGSSVDGFAAHKGALKEAGVWTSTLPWPGAVGAAQILERDGRTSYRARLVTMADAATAYAKTQAFLDQLVTCDTWCDGMQSAQTQNDPTRVEVSYTRADPSRLAPRCAAARPKMVLELVEAGNTSADFVVEAP